MSFNKSKMPSTATGYNLDPYVLLRHTEHSDRFGDCVNEPKLVTGTSALDVIEKAMNSGISQGSIFYDSDGKTIFVEYHTKYGFVHRFWIGKVTQLTPADLKKEGIEKKENGTW